MNLVNEQSLPKKKKKKKERKMETTSSFFQHDINSQTTEIGALDG